MATVVDLSGSESGGFPPLPNGVYRVAITEAEIKESGPEAKNPGALYINWEFTVQDGEFENRKLWTITSLLPQALFHLKGLVAAIGKHDPNGSLDVDDIVDEYVSEEVLLVVKQKLMPEQYWDDPKVKQYNNVVKSFKSVHGEGGAPPATSGKKGKNSLLPG